MSASVWGKLPLLRRRQPKFAGTFAGQDSLEAEAIYWLPMDCNLGFAGANNEGLVCAFRDKAVQAAWLLNTDTVVHPGALSELSRMVDQEPSLGMIGSTLCFYHRPDTVQALGVEYNLCTHVGLEIHRNCSARELPTALEVSKRLSYVVGASMLITRNFYSSVGAMEDRYFLYYEEIDWALRASDVQGEGLGLGWARDSIVYHKEGGSIGTRANARPSDTALYYLSVNLLRFPTWRRRSAVPTALIRLAMRGLRALSKGDWRGAELIFIAFTDWMAGRFRRGPIGSEVRLVSRAISQ